MTAFKRTFLGIFQRVTGVTGSGGIDFSFFNAVTFMAALLGLVLGFVQLSLNLGPVAFLVLGFSVFMGFCYWLSRFRGLTMPLRWPVILSYLFLLVITYLVNNGFAGGTQLYFFVGGLVSLFLVQGSRRKSIVVVFYLLTSAILLYIDLAHPEWISGPADDVRQIYYYFSFFFAQFVLYLMLIIISSNYEQVLNALGTYHKTFAEDLVLARAVQNQVLQYSPEITADYDFDLVHRPSTELSGDVYDLSRPDPTYLRVLLADARGHGINAALISMLIKSEYLNANSRSMNPGMLMSRLNLRIFERYEESLSLSAIIVDIYRNRLVYSSGGHVPQFLVSGGRIQTLEADGPPLGLFKTPEYPENERKFGPEDRLFLFTDALTEELDLNGQAVGEDWLKGLARQTATAADHSRRIIERLADLKGQTVEKLDCQDDLTLIVIGTNKA